MCEQQRSCSSYDSSAHMQDLCSTESLISFKQLSPEHQRDFAHSKQAVGMILPSPNQLISNSHSIDQPQQPFTNFKLGFTNATGSKSIHLINYHPNSKNFFDETQILNIEQTQTEIPFQNNLQVICDDSLMPNFATVGKGIRIEISKEAQKKALQFFKQDLSVKKTKVKATLPSLTLENSIKTLNSNLNHLSRQHILGIDSKNINNSQRNLWKSYPQIFEKKNKFSKKTENGLRIQVYKEKKFKILRLTDLEIQFGGSVFEERKLILKKYLTENKKERYEHNSQKCNQILCILCQIKYEKNEIEMKDFYDLVHFQLDNNFAPQNNFATLFAEVELKLQRYTILYQNEIWNKRLTASNLVVELNKKITTLNANESGDQWWNGDLRFYLEPRNLGMCLNLIIEEVVYCEQAGFFLKLSNGWSIVWGLIEKHNCLYEMRSKFEVGRKICISNWNIHPVNNILKYNSFSHVGQSCIEFHYNGSLILNFDAKLGRPNQAFYRPLHKCRAKGGLIPKVQGFVIRMFISELQPQKQKPIRDALVEILTLEGYTSILKMNLPNEVSLAEYFRLYRLYIFSKIRINEQMQLNFQPNISKYWELDQPSAKPKSEYPCLVLQLLNKRFLNIHSCQIGQLYDFYAEDRSVKQQGKGIFEVAASQINLETKASHAHLYQQFELVNIEQKLTFRRLNTSSVLKKLPKVYMNLVKAQEID